MALEIYLSADGEAPTHATPDDSLKLYLDEVYAYLHPHLKAFQRATGVAIDLYDDSFITGPALDALRTLLLRLADELERTEADTWVVSLPHRPASAPNEPLLLHRRELAAVLARFLALTDRARVLGVGLVCLGD